MDHILEYIRSNGLSLRKSLGVNSIALTADHAIEACKLCKKNHVGILGGDVLIRRNGELFHTYDSWSRDRLPVGINSADYSIDYIISYVTANRGDYLFNLIIDIPD